MASKNTTSSSTCTVWSRKCGAISRFNLSRIVPAFTSGWTSQPSCTTRSCVKWPRESSAGTIRFISMSFRRSRRQTSATTITFLLACSCLSLLVLSYKRRKTRMISSRNKSRKRTSTKIRRSWWSNKGTQRRTSTAISTAPDRSRSTFPWRNQALSNPWVSKIAPVPGIVRIWSKRRGLKPTRQIRRDLCWTVYARQMTIGC